MAKSLTTGRGKSYWFMLEPLIMSKQIFDALPKNQQEIIMALGAELEQFGTKEAMADDQKVAEVYAKKGAKVSDLDEATVDKWRAIARATAWKDYADKTPLAAELIKLATAVHVLIRKRLDGPRPRRVETSAPAAPSAMRSGPSAFLPGSIRSW